MNSPRGDRASHTITHMNVNDLQSAVSLRTAERCALAMKEAKGIAGYPLSDATLRYVAALYDPRGCFEAPWIPSQTALSQKTRFFARGSFSTGTTGIGYIGALVAGDYQTGSLIFSTPTTVMTPSTNAASATNNSSAVTNSPYDLSIFGTGAQQLSWRPVGAALYVRYAGTELNRGGDMLLMEEPNHSDGMAYSYNTALSIDGVKRIPIDGDWHHVCVTPNTVGDTNWSTSSNYYGGRPLMVFINSAAGNAQPYEFEFYVWGEFLGTPARAVSASYNDVVGFDCVQGAANMYMQLDSELGLDGFVKAIHAQQAQTSGCRVVGAPAGNWAGLLSFLPAIANLVGPPLVAAARGALGGLSDHFGVGRAARQRPVREVKQVEIVEKKKTKPKKKKPGSK